MTETMTANRYGHLFPCDSSELAAATKALMR
jgi:hypothetical protein